MSKILLHLLLNIKISQILAIFIAYEQNILNDNIYYIPDINIYLN